MEEMLSVDILKTQVLPTFSESCFVTVGLVSVPSLGFLYNTSAFGNSHLNFLFNLVTYKLKLFHHF